MKKYLLLFAFICTIPSVTFAYISTDEFCAVDFGNTDVNGTFTYNSSRTWYTHYVYSNGDVNISGENSNSTGYGVIYINSGTGNQTDQQAYFATDGIETVWTVDSGTGNTSPAGTVTLGACEGGEEPTATSTATTTPYANIEFGIAIIIALLSFGLIGFIWNTFNKRKKPWQ